MSSTNNLIVTQDADVIDKLLNKKPVDSWTNATEVTSTLEHPKAQPSTRPFLQSKEWICNDSWFAKYPIIFPFNFPPS